MTMEERRYISTIPDVVTRWMRVIKFILQLLYPLGEKAPGTYWAGDHNRSH
jgi:hypothetical protein